MKQSTTYMHALVACELSRAAQPNWASRKPMGIVVLGVDCVAAPPADRELLSD